MLDAKRERLLDRYQRLIELSRDLASTLDLDTLLKRIVHAAADPAGSCGNCLRHDPDQGR